MQAREKYQTIADAAEIPGPDYVPGKKPFWIGLAIIAAAALAAVIWVSVTLQAREAQFTHNLQKRLELIAASQVQVVNALIDNAIGQANRVINSELYKLYAAEVDRIGDDVSLLVSGPLPDRGELSDEIEQLAAQLPMMQSLLLEFTRITDYQAGRVVNRNGMVFIATDAATAPLRADQLVLVRQALKSRSPQFAPLRHTEQGLVLEAFLPIFPPESSGHPMSPVAVLLLTRLAGEHLAGLDGSLMMEPWEKAHLLQKTADGYQQVVPSLPGQLRDINTRFDLDQNELQSFAVRPGLNREGQTYSLARRVAGPNWWVVVEADYDSARASLISQRSATISIATLLVVVLGFACGIFWALLLGYYERKGARHYAALAGEIEKQRRLLDQINNTISDYIVLQDLQGRYLYVNPAFAAAVGREPGEITGLDDQAIFGQDVAQCLEIAGRRVLAGEEPFTSNELVCLQSQPRHLQITRSGLKDAAGVVTGIVSVIRDVTEIVEMRKRREQAAAKTVEALVRAIELTDPYLAGHSRMMVRLGVEVAKGMHASEMEIATVATAANLSQIGKLFVDRELLIKAEPLTDIEKTQLEQHVAHAARVLDGIDFGLPVYQAVCQMNEMLDGQGYPGGLQGEEISLPARILAVVNSFCAMVAPRAYRAARPVDESMAILAAADQSYDQRVVSVLGEVVLSAAGAKILAGTS